MKSFVVLALTPLIGGALSQRTTGLNCTEVKSDVRSPLCDNLVRVCTADAEPSLLAVTEENFETEKAACETRITAWNAKSAADQQTEALAGCPIDPDLYISRQLNQCDGLKNKDVYCRRLERSFITGGLTCGTYRECRGRDLTDRGGNDGKGGGGLGLLPCFSTCEQCFDEATCLARAARSEIAYRDDYECISSGSGKVAAAAAAVAFAIAAVVF